MARSVSAAAIFMVVLAGSAMHSATASAAATAWFKFNGTAATAASVKNQRRNNGGVVLGYDTLADSFPPAPANSDAFISDAQDCIAQDGNTLRNGWTVRDTFGAKHCCVERGNMPDTLQVCTMGCDASSFSFDGFFYRQIQSPLAPRQCWHRCFDNEAELSVQGAITDAVPFVLNDPGFGGPLALLEYAGCPLNYQPTRTFVEVANPNVPFPLWQASYGVDLSALGCNGFDLGGAACHAQGRILPDGTCSVNSCGVSTSRFIFFGNGPTDTPAGYVGNNCYYNCFVPSTRCIAYGVGGPVAPGTPIFGGASLDQDDQGLCEAWACDFTGAGFPVYAFSYGSSGLIRCPNFTEN